MNRRQFGLTTLVGSLLSFFGLSTILLESTTPIITRLFTHHESAIALGRSYLDLFPDEANYDYLAQHTLHHIPTTTIEIQSIKKILQTQRQEDFRNSHTVILNGWVLSRTEARLCALLALT